MALRQDSKVTGNISEGRAAKQMYKNSALEEFNKDRHTSKSRNRRRSTNKSRHRIRNKTEAKKWTIVMRRGAGMGEGIESYKHRTIGASEGK